MATGLINKQYPRVESGTFASVAISGNNSVNKVVSFSDPFDSDNYRIFITVQSNITASAMGSIAVSYNSKGTSGTGTGFTIRAYNAGSTSRTVNINWIAMDI